MRKFGQTLRKLLVGISSFKSQNSRNHSRDGIRPRFAFGLAPLNERGRRESRMPAAPEASCAGFGRSAHKLQSPQVEPNIRLSLHGGAYGLCRICPGRNTQSARRHATVLRLAVRSDSFAFALAWRTSCASITRFCRTPPASAIVHIGKKSLHTRLGVPPSRSSRRTRCSQRPS